MLAYNIYNGFCKHLFDVGVEVYEVPFDLAASALQKHLQGVSKAEAAAFLDGCDGGDFAADLLYYLNEQGSGYDWDKPDALTALQSALDRVCADWLADASSPRAQHGFFKNGISGLPQVNTGIRQRQGQTPAVFSLCRSLEAVN